MIFRRLAALDFDLAVKLLVGIPIVFLVGVWQLGLLPLRLPIIIGCFVRFYAFLSLSIVSYRLSPFHRLYAFPGPPVCRITKLWIVYIVYRGQYHKYLKELHNKYGDFVRVGRCINYEALRSKILVFMLDRSRRGIHWECQSRC